jgi:nucleotide-binding universal stress UspA family protein
VDLIGRFPPVVAGVDGSPLAEAGSHAAVAEARRRLLPVRLVRAFDWPSSAAPAAPPQAGREAARRAASAELSRLRNTLLPEYPGCRITKAVVDGPPTSVLVAESASATMLVLGAHGDGRLAGVLGPVRATVLRRSTSPVLSAAAIARWGAGAPVVVGVNTGDELTTRHLLSTGLLEAATRSSSLVVVDLRSRVPGATPTGVDLPAVCRGLDATSPGVGVRFDSSDESSPLGLPQAARAAQLLVVGRGEPSEPLTAILRSVLTQSVVPVLVVPPATDVRARGPVRALSLVNPS